MGRIRFYRALFFGAAVVPAIEVMAIPWRRSPPLGEPDAFMMLILVCCGIGLVLTDILRQLDRSSSSESLRPTGKRIIHQPEVPQP